MNNSNILDKVYLALELTKIRYNGLLNADTKDIETDTNILNTYLYYIEELTQISLEEIDNIPKLKNKLEDLKNKYNILYDNFELRVLESIANNNEDTLKYLESVKADMESYVYKELKNKLTNS